MSDDEYYADSPYDEFEEMLWDADPGANLADDLAQHASYSPVWQDDPAGELDTYHSDWEYYSDDYWDDDPDILKNNPIDGSPRSAINKSESRSTRSRKRKYDELKNSVDSITMQSLKSTIQGTVWAKADAPRTEIFKSGQCDKVALLTDWRKKFQVEKKRPQMSNKVQLKRDESWANELSLADMGLIRVREQSEARQDVAADENQNDLDIENEETSEDDQSEGYDSYSQDEHQMKLPETAAAQQSQRQHAETGLKAIIAGDHWQGPESQNHDRNKAQQSRGKRRKIDRSPPTQLLSLDAKSSDTSRAKMSRFDCSDKVQGARSSNDSSLSPERSLADDKATSPIPYLNSAITQKRKRGLSSSSGEGTGAVSPQPHGGGKRLASKK